jgi:hypothetical protein
MRSPLPAARVGVVHDVVVEECTRMHEFECGAGVDVDLLVRTTARTNESPVAERRPESFATGEHQAADLIDRLSECRLEVGPALALGCEEFVESARDASCYFKQ